LQDALGDPRDARFGLPSVSRAQRGTKPRAATVKTMAWKRGSKSASKGQFMNTDFSYAAGTDYF